MPENIRDRWANMAALSVTESAINTLTFSKLESGISLFEKLAWCICRIEYRYTPDIASLADSGDYLDMAITTSNNLAAITGYNEPAVLDYRRVLYLEAGTPANFALRDIPFVVSFADMPGGGLIVPPNPLYLAAKATGETGVSTVTVRFWYTNIALKPEEYWELVEARRVIS